MNKSTTNATTIPVRNRLLRAGRCRNGLVAAASTAGAGVDGVALFGSVFVVGGGGETDSLIGHTSDMSEYLVGNGPQIVHTHRSGTPKLDRVIPFPARNNMYVIVENNLPGGCTVILNDVETIRLERLNNCSCNTLRCESYGRD
jgi:hypothetical protein